MEQRSISIGPGSLDISKISYGNNPDPNFMAMPSASIQMSQFNEDLDYKPQKA